MSELVEHAKAFVEAKVQDLTGEEDIMPFMLLNCNAGHVYAGLLMPDTDDEKNKLADTMMALCATHRPSEVMFVSTAWMVLRKSSEDLERSLPPSEQADRMETVFMVHHTDSTSKSDTYSAAVTRRVDGTVVLSEWKDTPGSTVAGRFGEAIQHGMTIGEHIPPNFADWLDSEIEAGRAGDAMKSVLKVLGKVREQGVSRN